MTPFVEERNTCEVYACKELCRHNSGRVRGSWPAFAALHCLQWSMARLPISSFPFNFVKEDVLQNAPSGHLDGGVEPLRGNRVSDLEYADLIAC